MKTSSLNVCSGISEKPFLSIVLSIYNIKNYLERCINSIQRQKSYSYEVIFVDDGSTDGSEKICDILATEFDNAKVIHKENGGLSSARNAGLEIADGEYVFFFDPDDWIEEGFLDCIYNIAKKDKPDVIKYGYNTIQNGEIKNTIVPCFNEGLYVNNEIREIILPQTICSKALFDYNSIAITSAWASVFSTSFLKNNNIRFESERIILNEDYLFNLAVMIKAKSVYVIHQSLYNYDYRINSLSKRYIRNMEQRKKELFDRYKTYLVKANLFETLEREYYGFCVDGYYAIFTNECSAFTSKNFKETRLYLRDLFMSKDCQYALKNCNHNNLTIKGAFIYYLMRIHATGLMIYLYSFAKITNNCG